MEQSYISKTYKRVNESSIKNFLKDCQHINHETAHLIISKNIRDQIKKHPKIKSLNQARKVCGGSMGGILSLATYPTWNKLLMISRQLGDPDTGEPYSDRLEEKDIVLPFLKDIVKDEYDTFLNLDEFESFQCSPLDSNEKQKLLTFDTSIIPTIGIIELEHFVRENISFRYSIYRKILSSTLRQLVEEDHKNFSKMMNRKLTSKLYHLRGNTCFPRLESIVKVCRALGIDHRRIYYRLIDKRTNALVSVSDYVELERMQHREYMKLTSNTFK